MTSDEKIKLEILRVLPQYLDDNSGKKVSIYMANAYANDLFTWVKNKPPSRFEKFLLLIKSLHKNNASTDSQP